MKSGFIGIIGRPNVGKSTFLNAAIGVKVSIVTPKPQTTRDNIRGIYNENDMYIVFVDTPGIQKPKSALDQRMIKQSMQAINDCDCVLMVTEAGNRLNIHDKDRQLIDILKETKTPSILAINKIDTVSKGVLLPQIETYAAFGLFQEIVPISALKNDGVEDLIRTLGSYLPEGPAYYPEDMITDSPTEFIVAEVIREKAILHTREEVPYSVGVRVEDIQYKGKKLMVIRAVIVVERDSQKGIIIGKRGSMLKTIGSEARRELQWLLDKRIYLELFVKVVPNWTRTDRGLLRNVSVRPYRRSTSATWWMAISGLRSVQVPLPLIPSETWKEIPVTT